MKMQRFKMVAATMLLATSSLYAAESAASSQGDKPLSAIEHGMKAEAGSNQSVEQCWTKWLQEEDLKEGKNEKNGHLILISRNTDAVIAAPDSPKWVSARKAAFQQTEINARAALAGTMSTLIQSDRSLMAHQFGGDDAPPALQNVAKALSIADKANVLADKALDNEIGKYDPNWNKDASPTQKKEAVPTVQEHVTGNVAASAQLFAAGAFTVTECEGPSTDAGGRYAVLTGLIWRPKLASVAESIWNPALKLPAEAPGGTLAEQFESFSASNPEWMAYTMGTRVFTNEKGERVVVGFGVVPQTALISLDKRRAGLDAFAAIQRFVGEKIVSGQQSHDSFETRAFADGSTNTFDNSKYNDSINLVSKDLKLNGATEVLSWRGDHPWSQAKMQVVAFAWSPSWAADSEKTSEMMQSIERRMSDQGAVPAGATQTKGHPYRGAGAAVPARAGAKSSSQDF